VPDQNTGRNSLDSQGARNDDSMRATAVVEKGSIPPDVHDNLIESPTEPPSSECLLRPVTRLGHRRIEPLHLLASRPDVRQRSTAVPDDLSDADALQEFPKRRRVLLWDPFDESIIHEPVVEILTERPPVEVPVPTRHPSHVPPLVEVLTIKPYLPAGRQH
jgi:hypothetical protein